MKTKGISEMTFAQLVDRARALAVPGTRTILGITGAPGSGKSTLAERVVHALGPEVAVLVPMDGFHLATTVLHDLDRQARKGAEDTFDGFGYVALIRRIHEQHRRVAEGSEGIIYSPLFRRDLEEPLGSAIAVNAETPLVITEGNYLLLHRQPWPQALEVIDEVWFLAPDESERLQRLIERHEQFGRSPADARERSFGSDQRNAELIMTTAGRADLVVRILD